MSEPRNARLRQGLSLLEVIIATVILAVSSVMLVKIIGNGDRNARRAEQRVMAQMICQNRLDEILAGILPLEPMDTRQDMYYPDWHYLVKVDSYLDESGISSSESAAELLLVEVQVFYQPIADDVDLGVEKDQFDRPTFSLKRIVRRKEAIETSVEFDGGGGFNESQ